MIRLGDKFKPSPRLKTLFWTYFALALAFGVFPWYVPLIVFTPLVEVWSIATLIWVVPALIAAYWIPRYYRSLTYLLTEDEIICRRGVWWKKTSIVPYNRVTNIDIIQGPIARKLGIASLRVQTAGYTAGPRGVGGAEASIDGVENYEELRDLILGIIRSRAPVAAEAAEERAPEVLRELRRIRQLLEKLVERA